MGRRAQGCRRRTSSHSHHSRQLKYACLTSLFRSEIVHRDKPKLGEGLRKKGCSFTRRPQVGRGDSSLRPGNQRRRLARVAKGFAGGQGCPWYVPIHFELRIAEILVVDSEGADPTGMGKMFQDPSLLSKLAANPKTAPLLADPSFMQKVRARSST